MSSHTITSYIGDNTPVTVNYDYTGPQHLILYPNEKAQPYIEATVDINSVLIGDDDVMADLSKKCMGRLEYACWENIQGRF